MITRQIAKHIIKLSPFIVAISIAHVGITPADAATAEPRAHDQNVRKQKPLYRRISNLLSTRRASTDQIHRNQIQHGQLRDRATTEQPSKSLRRRGLTLAAFLVSAGFVGSPAPHTPSTHTLSALLGPKSAHAGGKSFRPGAPIPHRVDLIELNHFVDEDGRRVFAQVIFWEWNHQLRKYVVQAWRLVKHPNQIPQLRHDADGRRYAEVMWHDDGVLRQVTSPVFRETFSQSDPERLNRQFFPEERRSGLAAPSHLGNPDAE